MLKLVQEGTGNTLELMGIVKDFLNRTQQLSTKRKNGQMGLQKIKKILHNKIVSNLKRPPTEWEKIFASYISDKGLIIRIHRELKRLNPPKINEPIQKWAPR
jgi:hypothetical protein